VEFLVKNSKILVDTEEFGLGLDLVINSGFFKAIKMENVAIFNARR